MTQAVRREVMEETGIEVEVTNLVGVYSNLEHLIEFTNVKYDKSLYLFSLRH
jgi:8-oxo-dGTP pyrophosphatase MutT (NUDIX family)